MSFELILYAVLIVMALLSPLCNALFRLPRREPPLQGASDFDSHPGDDDDCETSISIIIAAHDDGAWLKANLPLLLDQDYRGHYEVIVVDESSTDRTADILTQLKSSRAFNVIGQEGSSKSYPHFYTTFLPASSHYLSRRKMAMTLGARAAKGRWLLFVDADCRPDGRDWLRTFASYFSANVDMVLGNVRYAPDAKSFQRYLRLLTQCYAMRRAQRSMPYRHWGGCLAVRRRVFEAKGGFTPNRRYLRGEYDFMANEFAERGRTALALQPESSMEQRAPSRKAWLLTTLTYMETRRHLRRSISWRLLHCADQLMLHATYLAIIATAVVGIITHSYLMPIAAAVSLLANITLRIAIARRALRIMGHHMPLWLLPLMELGVVWHGLITTLRYMRSDKRDYIVNM